MARKAYYIHGTTSDNDRWSNYPSTVQQLNRIAFGIGVDKNDTEGINDMGSEKFKEACCDFSFEWGNNGILKAGNNWFLNTVEDRRINSTRLYGMNGACIRLLTLTMLLHREMYGNYPSAVIKVIPITGLLRMQFLIWVEDIPRFTAILI